MASIAKHKGKWTVRWREPVAILDPAGHEVVDWAERRKSCPTKAAAQELARRIETAHALGERWVDERVVPVPTLGALGLAFVAAVVDADAPEGTQRYRSSMIDSFLAFAGTDRPVTDLSLALLEQYAASLPSEGRRAATRHRKVLEVEQMWEWGHKRPETWPKIPPPRKATGGQNEPDKVRAPPPVVAPGAPTWREVDLMIGELLVPWHKLCARLIRCTGLRASQAVGLKWSDVEFERRFIRARAGRVGAKRGKGRAIPLHPDLLEELRAWKAGPTGAYPHVFARVGEGKSGKTPEEPGSPPRGDAIVEPFRRAWIAAEIPRDRWDGTEAEEGEEGERGHASPSHAIRRCIRVELIRAGVEEALALYLVGQTQGVTAAAYVPEDRPETSPYWPHLVDAVSRIPGWRETSPGPEATSPESAAARAAPGQREPGG